MQNCSQKNILSCSYPKCLLFHQLAKAANRVFIKYDPIKLQKNIYKLDFIFLMEVGGGGGTGALPRFHTQVAAQYIVPIPQRIPDITLQQSLRSSESNRSGRTDTIEICRNPPQVKGTMKKAKIPHPVQSRTKAIIAPIIPTKAVENWALAASLRLNPDFIKIAKSPSSWGISWIKIHPVVTKPTLVLTKKAPPTANP